MKNSALSIIKNNATALFRRILLAALASTPVLASAEWVNLGGPGCGGGYRVSAFSPDPLKERLILGADIGGIYVSEPDSDHRRFGIHNDGLIHYRIQSLTFRPDNPDVVFAGTRGGVAASNDGGITWEMKREGFEPFASGGSDSGVYPVAIDPANPQIMYAGLGAENNLGSGFGNLDLLGYVYRSTDGGETWEGTQLDGLGDESIMAIVIDPVDSSIVYLLSQHRLFRSTDAGQTWTPQDTLPYADATYTDLVIKRDEPNVLLLSYARHDGDVTGVEKSTDHGQTWEPKLSVSMNSASRGINHIRKHPVENETFFITFDQHPTEGLQVTRDTGDTWEKINELSISPDSTWFGLSERPSDVAIDPNDPNRIAYTANGPGSAYLSEDGGMSWEQICTTRTATGAWESSGLNILSATDVVVNVNEPKTILLAYRDRTIFKSEDGGQTFFKGSDPAYDQPGHVYSMTVDPDDPETIYLTRRRFGSNKADTGVLKSEDFGETFVQIGDANSGLAGEQLFDIEIDPFSDPSQRTLYVATDDAGVFKTIDGGASWNSINAGLPADNTRTYDIAIDPTDSQTLYVGARVSSVSGYVAKSTDGGLSWNVVLGVDDEGVTHTSDVDIRAVVVDPSDPNIVYAGSRDAQGRGVNKIFWWSDDKGETWNAVSGDEFEQGQFSWDPHTYHLSSIATDPTRPGRVYVGFGSNGREHRFTGGVYYSDEFGRAGTWKLLDLSGLGHFVTNELIVDPRNPDRLYLASGGNGFYRNGPPPNGRPTVSAGPDQTITRPETLNLDGTVTDDGLPDPPGTVSTLWTKTGGPGTVAFGDETAVDTTATFSEVGTYGLRLTADDSMFTEYDETTITVTDAVDVISAEYKQVNSELSVTATSSEDGSAALTVDGYGAMSYNAGKAEFRFKDRPVADPDGTVTVTSDLGGSATVEVTYR